MGMKLIQFYKLVSDEAGLQGKTKLAMSTKIPSTKAAMEPDSAENLAKFAQAYKEITGKAAPAV
jgi:hypothetical protein